MANAFRGTASGKIASAASLRKFRRVRRRSIRRKLVKTFPPPLLHEAPDKLRNLIRCSIEREMARIEDVDLGLRYVLAVAFRLPKVEREIVLTPNHQQPRLLLAHPCLPLGIGVDVRGVVVEEVALNVGLAGLIEKIKFVGPEIRVIAFHVWIVPNMARPRRRQRQEICAKRSFVGSAIGPKRASRFPICPETFVMRHSVLHDESFDPLPMRE